ncbi:MAG: copper resistance protein CopC [Verrucomicrobia bacterium]|nr:MAG: copper resistance protein CopC [Verrucomicrobiota bacterium]
MSPVRRILFICLLVLIPVAQACAHAFLERSDPAVGGKMHSAPAEVRIWFTEAIEPAFSSIQVFDTAGKQLDKKDTHVDSTNRSLLHVSLPPLPGPGSYKVVWRVVSVDTHVTKGNFTFQVVP